MVSSFLRIYQMRRIGLWAGFGVDKGNRAFCSNFTAPSKWRRTPTRSKRSRLASLIFLQSWFECGGKSRPTGLFSYWVIVTPCPGFVSVFHSRGRLVTSPSSSPSKSQTIRPHIRWLWKTLWGSGNPWRKDRYWITCKSVGQHYGCNYNGWIRHSIKG